ncbi:MAG: plastocyanin/azurin family copper-binding protein [Candidatus Hydrothermarchaeaceae archaeon]
MLGLLVIVLILMSGCTKDYSGAPQPATPSPATTKAAPSPDASLGVETLVKVEHTKFTPPALKIEKGTLVTWKNMNEMNHPISTDGLFDSGALGLDQEYSYTFKDAGTFTVLNKAHGVTMSVTVTG